MFIEARGARFSPSVRKARFRAPIYSTDVAESRPSLRRAMFVVAIGTGIHPPSGGPGLKYALAERGKPTFPTRE